MKALLFYLYAIRLICQDIDEDAPHTNDTLLLDTPQEPEREPQKELQIDNTFLNNNFMLTTLRNNRMVIGGGVVEGVYNPVMPGRVIQGIE